MAANIIVVSKHSAETLQNTASNRITLNEPSIVQMGVNRADVAKMERLENSLVVTLKNGEVVTLDGFFDAANSTNNSLVLRDSDGTFWLAEMNPQSGAFALIDYLPLQSIEPLLLTEGTDIIAMPWLLGALGVGGVAALASAGGGSSSGSDNNGNSGGNKDTTPPNSPTGLNINDSGNLVSGRAEPGSTVIVRDADGQELGRGSAAADGSFNVSINPPQNNGQVVEVTATDAAGNVSDSAQVIAPDTTAPDAPTGVVINADGSVVNGTAEPGAKVIVRGQNGEEIGRGESGTDGKFSIVLTGPQANGEQISLIATDDAGNISAPTGITAPDITAPDAPTAVSITPIGDAISGQAEPNSTVIARDSAGNELGRGTTDANGNFNITLQHLLINGEQIQVTATDAAGNQSTPTNLVAPVIDGTNNTADLIDTLTIVADANTDGTINSSEIGVTRTVAVQVELGAGAQAGHVVIINDVRHTITANDITNGFLTANVAAPNDGPLNIRVIASDGQGGVDSLAGSVRVDTVADDLVGTITVLADVNADSTLNAGEIGGDGLIDVQIGLGANAQAGSVLTVNGQDYTISADDVTNGFINVEMAATEGNLIINASAIDADGNIDRTSTTVNVDTSPSNIIGPISIIGDVNNNGIISANEIDTSGNIPVRVSLAAETEIGDIITVNGTDYVVDADDLTAGSITANVAIGTDGMLAINVTATDGEGNTSTASSSVLVDTTPRDLLDSINTVADLNNDGLLNAAEIGADGQVDVQVRLGSEAVEGTVIMVNGTNYTVNAADLTNGYITAAVNASTQGNLPITVSATDAEGNTDTTTANLIVDTTPRNIIGELSVTADVNNDNLVNATEVGNDGLITVRVNLGPDAVAGNTITVNGTNYTIGANDVSNGFITTEMSATTQGNLAITATATDTEGNVDTASTSVAVDTIADDLLTTINITANLNNDGFINSAEAGSGSIAVQVELGNDAAVGTVINVNGTNYTVNASDLNNGYIVAEVNAGQDGLLNIDAAATDTQGNVDRSTSAINVDTTAPQVPALILTDFIDSGTAGDNITNDNNFNLALSAGVEPGATVIYQISTDGGANWTTTVAGQTALPDATYQFRAVVTDTAGNSASGTPVTVTVDTVVPAIPNILAFSADNTVLLGSGEVGTTVEVRDITTNELLATAKLNAEGQYAAVNAAGFANRSLRLVAIDAAGNTADTGTSNPVQGEYGLVTVVQNAIANLSDATMIEPVSILVNNLADPNTGTLSGLTGIVEQLTATNQPVLGAITELSDTLTAANTGSDANLGALINALNAVAGFLGSSDPADIGAANSNIATLLGAGDGTTVISDILNDTVAGGNQIVSDLLGGSIGINIDAGGLDELVNTAGLGDVVNGLTGVLNPILTGLSIPLQLLGINLNLATITNGLVTAVDNLLSGEEVIQNGVAQATGVLDDVAAGLLGNGALLNELINVLGLGGLGGAVNTLVGSVLTPIVDGVVNLANGNGILLPPNPGSGNSTTLLDELSTIVNDLTGGDSTNLAAISNLLDNIIRNDDLVAGDIVNSLNSLTSTSGGTLGTLTQLIQDLYNSDVTGLEDLTQGLGGLLNGLLDQTVEPLIDGVFGSMQPLPDTAGDDTLVSGLTNETFVGGDGSDSLIYMLLSDSDNAGGNGSDTWRDFHVGNTATDSQADQIDIGELLVDYNGDGSAASLDAYITVTQNGANTVLSIDRDGDGGVHASTDLLTLTNVNVDLDTLLANQQILI